MTEQTLREQVEGLNPKKKLAAILRGDSGGTATTHQQQTHELLCRFALCSACSSKLQPLALRSLVLEVRKGRTRGGGLRQHQAPSPPSSQKHQRSGRKTVEARVSLGEPRNCTDEPGVAPPTYLVLFMCIDKCDLYLLLIVG